MKKILISVGEFALPVPRKGSIEVLSGFGRASQVGQEIHQQVQSELADEFPEYQSEVVLSHEFVFGEYIFKVSGRLDGLFQSEVPRIEEIKTAFNVDLLRQRLEEMPEDHPYCLQLKTYGYLYWLKNGVLPELSFRLISTRHRKAQELAIDFSLETCEAWIQRRLGELADEVKRSEARNQRRKKLSEELDFPFPEPRRGQLELVQTLESSMQGNQRLLLQAPTGLGKTMGVMYPSLKEALSRGQKLVYLTPKNSQHAVAENAIDQFESQGSRVKSLTITAKSKMCLKGEPLCNPDYCGYAKDHYTKVYEHHLPQKLAQKRKLTAKTFRSMGKKYEVCPFELQLDAAVDVDVVICDYNYAFAPRGAFGRLSSNALAEKGKPNLVIDEIHNLPARAMDYYSAQISTGALQRFRNQFESHFSRLRGKVIAVLDSAIDLVHSCRPRSGSQGRIELPMDNFLEHDLKLKELVSQYLDGDQEIKPGDIFLQLSFYWSEFMGALEMAQIYPHVFFTSFQEYRENKTVKITCCDASEMLKPCYDEYEKVVGFSATLKPFDFYSSLTGLRSERLRTAEFVSPFPKGNRKLVVIPQLSSKYSARERNYPRIAEAIRKIVELRRGNYFAFFPSFDFMDRVLAEMGSVSGFEVVKQEKGTKAEDVEVLLEQMRDPQSAKIIFAVQGGVFAEGVDYPGEMLIGAFVVGAPLPNFDVEREGMRKYYQDSYGAGFDYAYAFPAMAKAVQAAGRVIRTEQDRGLIVLMDDRFIAPNFSKAMPGDWFEDSPMELVSQKILAEISEFWQQHT